MAHCSALCHCHRAFLSCNPSRHRFFGQCGCGCRKSLGLPHHSAANAHLLEALNNILKATANELNLTSVTALLCCSIEASKAAKDKISLWPLWRVLSSSLQPLRNQKYTERGELTVIPHLTAVSTNTARRYSLYVQLPGNIEKICSSAFYAT